LASCQTIHLQGKESDALAAGDTFRAAAVEQYKSWRNVIRFSPGFILPPPPPQQKNKKKKGRGPPPPFLGKKKKKFSSVIYDALQAAKHAEDILIAIRRAFTTQSNFDEELKKVKRVMAKLDTNAPHEIIAGTECCTGQKCGYSTS